MGSLGEHLAQATHTSSTASHNHQRWTPSARRCSRSSPRPTASMPSSTTSRRRPRSRTGGPTRPTVTSGTMVRRSTVLRSSLTRPATSCRRPPSPWSRRRRCTERWRAMFPPSPVGSCSLEEEAKKSEENLAGTVTKLATTSKEADNILKKVKAVESTCMNNEVTLEELDKNLRASTKMAADNEQKLDELSRKLGVQEDELKRAIERAKLAENKLKSIEEELQMVGENMKSLETSAEKAVEREEKLKEKILSIQRKYKAAEDRFEYGEMSITK